MVKRFVFRLLSAVMLAGGLAPFAQAQEVVQRYPALHHPVRDPAGMVAAQNKIAASIGADVLARGGNAIDSAVAVGFALAVTLPRAGNLGGGGFMLVYLADEDRTIAIDYREMAPAAASRDMFLNADGDVDNNVARFSLRAAGVPGTVAGLHHAHERYGSLPWHELLQPAIQLAERGIIVTEDFAFSIRRAEKHLSRDPDAIALFTHSSGTLYEEGERLKQPLLAKTLKRIAKSGTESFYQGDIAELIVKDMRANGGLITRADLENYQVIEREPVIGGYRGYDIISMPPPSSGGVHVVQMLNILEQFPLADFGAESALTIHVIVEAMRQAYADRSQHLGDPDYYDVPIDWLTSSTYAEEIAAGISLETAKKSDDVRPGTTPVAESPETTHYSVMDQAGNAVANTYTLNFSFGSGNAIAGAGFLINNEMDDFSAKPGVPNAFGLLGGEANAIQPGKRPLSSMTPTLVFKDGKPLLATGSPGGSRIITAVLQQIINVIDFEMNLADSVSAPRLHHQWYPDSVFVERGFSPDTLALLKAMGHNIATTRFSMGSVQAVMRTEDGFAGAADPRRPDSGAYGPTDSACLRAKIRCLP